MSAQTRGTEGHRRKAAGRRHARAAIIAAAGLTLLTVVVFVGTGWLTSHYELRAVFSSANGLQPGSEVRIAGANVGQVSGVTAGPHNQSVVTMHIDPSGLPIHADATLAIEPRLILEGNYYVNLDPGSPGAPQLHSGSTIPESDTTVPVQIDQVLDTFDLATRNALTGSIQALAGGLGTGEAATASGSALPTGYTGLRNAIRALHRAVPAVTHVAVDAQGTRPGDLNRAIVSSRNVAAQLAQSPAHLADLVAAFNTVTGALSSQDHALGASVQQLDLLERVAPPSFAALDAALPTLTAFAHELNPALRAAPGPLRNVTGLANQVQALVQPSQLPTALEQLAPVTEMLPQLEHGLGILLPLVTPVDRCLSGHVEWALDQKLQDGSLSTGDPAWLDMLHAFTGVTSVDGGFDGNGSALRAGVTEGASTFSAILPGVGAVAGIGPSVQGMRPVWLGYGVSPPYRPDQWCDQQPVPNLVAKSVPPGAPLNAERSR